MAGAPSNDASLGADKTAKSRAAKLREMVKAEVDAIAARRQKFNCALEGNKSSEADKTKSAETSAAPPDNPETARPAASGAAEQSKAQEQPDPRRLKDLKWDGDGPHPPVLEVTALALSGGGIRSASFSLGVVQALNAYGCLPRIDYLSTVSGGGYLGSALSASLKKSGGEFVFGKPAQLGTSARTDVKDSPQLGHLRNYSNYLIPFGGRDVVTALAIITRGLVANGAIVLAFALIIAAFTIQGNPYRTELLTPNLFHYPLSKLDLLYWLKDMHFGVTLLLVLIGLLLFFFWALYRSAIAPPPDIRRTGFGFWWTLIFISFALLAGAMWFGSLRTSDMFSTSVVFLAILLAELLVAFAVGRSAALRQQLGFQWVWLALTLVYVVAVYVFLRVAQSSSVFFEVSMLLVPVSFMLLLWARLAGLSRWEPGHLGDQAEFRTNLPTLFATYLVLVAVFVVAEFQPFVINGMFELSERANANTSHDSNHSMAAEFVKWLATIVAPVGAVVTFFREQIGTLFKSVTSSSKFTTKLLAVLVVAATWIGGAAVPLLIWIGYLYLCFWGIENNGKPTLADIPAAARPAIHGTIKIEGPGVDLNATIKCGPGERDDCAQPQAAKSNPPKPNDHAPVWLIGTADFAADTYNKVAPIVRPAWLNDVLANQAVSAVRGWLNEISGIWWVSLLLAPFRAIGSLFDHSVPGLYTVTGLLLLWLSWWLRPNANSLHQLYRDRLSKAFLFNPKENPTATKSAVHSDVDPVYDPIGTMPLTELLPLDPHAPYHLINATLNVQGSDYANRRGRNSDFFLFSPLYVGSDATGYAGTKEMQDATNLDIATAMTISGAAFSPNAGAASIAPLTPTLAFLNVRTGYWLTNPRIVSGELKPKKWSIVDSAYLWNELTGRLREDSEEVFLSDGGHIENLGIYELLRRRCQVIVVVDAEADPALRYPSFIALQRYARIDLGVRINMPWDQVRKTTLCWMGYTGDPNADDEKSKKGPKPSRGPHVSIGTIEYDGKQLGWLVYIKASLTGDENDYVRDYARRYDSFPHESTGDQFFSEEQFEVYRALGFHIASRFLNGEDRAQVYDDRGPILRNINAGHDNINPVRKALLG